MDLENMMTEYAALDKQLSSLGGSYIGLTTKKVDSTIEFISTGSVALDRAIGGIALGRIYEVFGPTGSAKSSLGLALCKSMQSKGHIVMWQDLEAVYTPNYAEACGVKLDQIIVSRPSTMNAALEGLRIAIGSGLVKLAVVDSVAAMVPKDEFDKDVGGGMIGTRARLMSSVLPQLVSLCAEHNSTVIFINQERAANLTSPFGNKSTTTGGNALPYYASVRIDMNRSGWLEDSKGNKIGIKVTAQAIKNKLFTPFKSAELSFRFLDDKNVGGFDYVSDLLVEAIKLGLVEKKGSWTYYKGDSYQGEVRLREALEKSEDMREELRQTILKPRENNEED